jgi:hypothetical protein
MLITGDCRAYVCREVVNMRNGIEGLSYIVEPLLAQHSCRANGSSLSVAIAIAAR